MNRRVEVVALEEPSGRRCGGRLEGEIVTPCKVALEEPSGRRCGLWAEVIAAQSEDCRARGAQRQALRGGAGGWHRERAFAVALEEPSGRRCGREGAPALPEAAEVALEEPSGRRCGPSLEGERATG